ncbi:hypothetical protein DFJ43DRAFT_703981 [Lentinula guzmanii]|uniref:Uncharacterized protein n=1 Tax=Lentinula guzmanii TaxID=2804957 RepID=A0AA38JFM1_9AGAR|nr:hypothetical protein DFJ43DRAFT_703981 [Lentinula guzmanii]
MICYLAILLFCICLSVFPWDTTPQMNPPALWLARGDRIRLRHSLSCSNSSRALQSRCIILLVKAMRHICNPTLYHYLRLLALPLHSCLCSYTKTSILPYL